MLQCENPFSDLVDRGVEQHHDGYPVIHLTINHTDVIANGFPVTTLPVHVWVDDSSMSYTLSSGVTPTSARPHLLQKLSVGDSITAKGLDSATFGCYLYSDSKTQTFGLTCGHLISDDSTRSPLLNEAISSPPLAWADEIHTYRSTILDDRLSNIQFRKNEEGETDRVMSWAAEVTKQMVKEGLYPDP